MKKQATLFDSISENRLSNTRSLPKVFVKLERMSSTELKNGGESLNIKYNFYTSLFGEILVASTSKGICKISFCDDQESAFAELKSHFPNAEFTLQKDSFQENALLFFKSDWQNLPELKLHLKGTDFQFKVWEALLEIPFGELESYGQIAEKIQKPKASRAVGTAIGGNPFAVIIPCHRVVQASGKLGGYMWGIDRKAAILAWEASQIDSEK